VKVKLLEKDSTLVAKLNVQMGELDNAPEAIVRKTDELGVIYHLSQRDDPDGAQVYTRIGTVLVLDK
jgi:hypothetical protein